MALRAVRGMNDILPAAIRPWQRFERAFGEHMARYGYGEVRTPLIEATELFHKQIGETTDVVEKEMYSFERHGDQLTVRPEATASCARAYVEHSVHAKEPISRWYYMGPMFRGERPAKGRYRQFHQAGAELYGDAGPASDAEMIEMVTSLLRGLGLQEFTVHVNSIGSGDLRPRYRKALVEYFTPHLALLSEDSKRRLETNPLRILDSKAPQDQALAQGAPSTLDLLDEADKAHWEGLLEHLRALDVPFAVDTRLVRGLDYYTRTLFEIRTSLGELGAQSAIAGGGRYDHMIENLGGPSIPAIGFALGTERLLSVLPELPAQANPASYVVPMTDAALASGLLLARDLRKLGLSVLVDTKRGSLKAMLRRADAVGARTALLLGDDELGSGEVTVKNLAEHSQAKVRRDALADALLNSQGAPT